MVPSDQDCIKIFEEGSWFEDSMPIGSVFMEFHLRLEIDKSPLSISKSCSEKNETSHPLFCAAIMIAREVSLRGFMVSGGSKRTPSL